jgi:hypothetical protein
LIKKTLINPLSLDIYFILREKLSIILDFSVWLRTGFNPAEKGSDFKSHTGLKMHLKMGNSISLVRFRPGLQMVKKLSNSRKKGAGNLIVEKRAGNLIVVKKGGKLNSRKKGGKFDNIKQVSHFNPIIWHYSV